MPVLVAINAACANAITISILCVCLSLPMRQPRLDSMATARDTANLIVLDAPAAGHAITFLLAARALLDAVRVGPINTQAKEVLELLTDPARCQVLLVTLPEETPVNEVVETTKDLGSGSGLSAHVELAGPDTDEVAPPTLVNNVERLANVPGIIARGAPWFRTEGTEESPGTIVCTVTGGRIT